LHKFKDITGQVFGRLTAVEYNGNNKHRQAVWLCKCECGNEITTEASSLKSGKTKSCGCLNRETSVVQGRLNNTHNMSSLRIYACWCSMKKRCINKNDTHYADYGGRGIGYSETWEVFENFYEDMGDLYADDLELDRIDVNGNYCKENCRWVNGGVQSHNQRKQKGCSSKYKGVCLCNESGKFQAYINFDNKRDFLGRFYYESDAALAHDNRSEELYGDRPNGTIASVMIVEKNQ